MVFSFRRRPNTSVVSFSSHVQGEDPFKQDAHQKGPAITKKDWGQKKSGGFPKNNVGFSARSWSYFLSIATTVLAILKETTCACESEGRKGKFRFSGNATSRSISTGFRSSFST